MVRYSHTRVSGVDFDDTLRLKAFKHKPLTTKPTDYSASNSALGMSPLPVETSMLPTADRSPLEGVEAKGPNGTAAASSQSVRHQCMLLYRR
jgi:hypothetical protein